jgi:hypothetical protein
MNWVASSTLYLAWNSAGKSLITWVNAQSISRSDSQCLSANQSGWSVAGIFTSGLVSGNKLTGISQIISGLVGELGGRLTCLAAGLVLIFLLGLLNLFPWFPGEK